MRKTLKNVLIITLVMIACALIFAACSNQKGLDSTTDQNSKPSGEKQDSDINDSGDVTNDNNTPSLPNGELEYVIDEGDNYVVITGIGAYKSNDLVIPKSIKGLPVTEIGRDAFEDCVNLTSVVIPDSVTKIGASAFDGCLNLESIRMGKAVAEIKDNAINGCSELKEIIVDESNSTYTSIDGTIYTKDKKTLVKYPAGKKDTSFVIPSEVTHILEDACAGNVYLTSVTLPKNLKTIEDYAFLSCYHLVEIINHSSLNVTLDNYIDVGYVTDDALEVHTGESKIKEKDGFLFYTCNNTNYLINYLGEEDILNLPNDYNGESYEIFKYAFYNKCFVSVTIPKSVSKIYSTAFQECRNFAEFIDLNRVFNGRSNVSYIDYRSVAGSKLDKKGDFYFYTYEGVNYLVRYVGTSASVKLPEDYNGQSYVINPFAFKNCFSVTNVTIPSNISSIPWSTFYNCKNLTDVIIDNGVKTIERNAFEYCGNLKNVSVPESIERINYTAFLYCPNLQYVKYDNAYYFGNAENPYLVLAKSEYSAKSCQIHKDTKIILKFESYIESISIPSNIISIESYAFCTSFHLSSISISDNVKYIGVSAFENSKLTSFTFPASVTKIEESVFQHCDFLTTVTIHSNITHIEDNAFNYCNKLTDIIFTGTKAQWDTIEKENLLEKLPENCVIHCTDGDIVNK